MVPPPPSPGAEILGHDVVDLFCGAGGFSLGFRRAGFDIKFAVDSDETATQCYEANFDGRVLTDDVRQLDFTNLDADVIVGGPPCQPFSRLGRNGKEDGRKELSAEFMQAVEEIRPQVFLIENVSEYLKTPQARHVGREARDLGYDVTATVLNADNHGVPQHRERAFILASREGMPFFPAPQEEVYSVRDAIGDLSGEPSGENWHIDRNYTELSERRYKQIPKGGSRFDLPMELRPPCWKEDHGGSTDVFGRLFWDEPSVTIRTEYVKPEKGRYLHPEDDRPITVREGARLQSFPDTFEFTGYMTHVVRHVGNAVPPRLAYRLGLAVKEHLEEGKEGETVKGTHPATLLKETVPRKLSAGDDCDDLLPSDLRDAQTGSVIEA